jgi:YD repeat-containing protein
MLWLARRHAGLKRAELGPLAGGLDYRGVGSALRYLAEVQKPDGGGTLSYAYTGNKTRITPPLAGSVSQWKEYAYDSFGNLTSVTEPNPSGGADVVTNYTYDLLNHLTGVSMPRTVGSQTITQTRTFQYNSTTQRLIQASHPETGSTSYEYNADGTLYTVTDAKGQKRKFTYDSYQRVTALKRYNAAGQEQVTQRTNYSYDYLSGDSGNSRNGWGRLVSASFNGHWYEYSYTPGGMVTEKIFKRAPSTVLGIGYSYDIEGKITSVGYPGYWTDDPQNPGQVIYMQGSYYQIFYDSLGRPNQMIEHDQYTNWQYMDAVKEVSYGSVGELLSLKRKADEVGQTGSTPFLQETWQYNTRLELTRHTVTPVGSGSPVWDATHQYYATGQIWKASDPMGGENVYTYDTLGRLTTAVNAAGGTNYPARGLSFSYDGFGNRLSQTVTLGSGPNVTVGGESQYQPDQ